jgi:hypothetical protein
LGQTRLKLNREAFSLQQDDTDKVTLDSLAISQEDNLSEVQFSLQCYKKLLLLMTYAFQDNESNSYGYAFQAHRIILMLTQNLPYGLIAQLYGSLQWRHYEEALIAMSLDERQMDEYEHMMYIAKISKAITEHLDIETQYIYKRSSSQQEHSYQQHLLSLSLNLIH